MRLITFSNMMRKQIKDAVHSRLKLSSRWSNRFGSQHSEFATGVRMEDISRRYSLTRFSMYNSLDKFMSENHYKGKVLLLSEANEHSIRNMFMSGSQFSATNYPEVNAMDLSAFNDESFDFVVTDQVLEHVPNPCLAMEQIRRKLKLGGIAINTSCSFNPIHDTCDFYRFTIDGFRHIHETYLGRILLLDFWGNREAIAAYVSNNYRNFDVRYNLKDLGLATRKEAEWPWVVWCVAQKVS